VVAAGLDTWGISGPSFLKLDGTPQCAGRRAVVVDPPPTAQPRAANHRRGPGRVPARLSQRRGGPGGDRRGRAAVRGRRTGAGGYPPHPRGSAPSAGGARGADRARAVRHDAGPSRRFAERAPAGAARERRARRAAAGARRGQGGGRDAQPQARCLLDAERVALDQPGSCAPGPSGTASEPTRARSLRAPGGSGFDRLQLAEDLVLVAELAVLLQQDPGEAR